MDIAERLQTIKLFKSVEAADRQALASVMQRQSFAKDQVVFARGDPGDSMYIILSGSVRVETEDAVGNVIVLRRLTEAFGEFSVLDQRPRSATVIADEDLEVLVLSRNDLINFVRQRPIVGLSMMRDLVERVRYTTLYLQQVLTATQQLAAGQPPSLEALAQSGADAEIQHLVQAFVTMAQEVQTREQALQRALDRPAS